MNYSKSGSGTTAVFILLFIASAALNIMLLSGCCVPAVCKMGGRECQCKDGGQRMPVQVRNSYDATDDLRDIADRLGVGADGNNASDIASAIKTKIYVDASGKGFPRDMLTAQQLKDVKEVLPEDKGEIISEYQRFIKSLEGKRFLVIP